MLNKNQQTNFVHKTGFEKHIPDHTKLGPIPHKGTAAVKAKDVNQHHFILGKDQSTFNRSVTTIDHQHNSSQY